MKTRILISTIFILIISYTLTAQNLIYKKQIDSLAQEISSIKEPNLSQARLYSQLATLYSKEEKFTEANNNNNKALNIFQNLKDHRNTCKVLLDLAMNYDKSNQFDQAIKYSFKALDILELFQKDLSTNEYEFRKGMIYMNMGIINGQINNNTESLKLLIQARDFLINADEFYKAVCYENLGNAYSELLEYDDALKYFNKAQEFYIVNDVEPMLITNTLNNIGNIYYSSKEYNKALSKFKKALSYIDKEDIYVSEKTGVLNSIADAYIELDSLQLAELYLDKSMDLSRGEGGQRFIKNNYKSRVKLYSKQKRYKAAYTNLNILKTIEDSLYEQQLIEKIASVKDEYELKVEQRDNLLKIKLLEREKELNRYKTYALFALIFLILFIALLIYNRQKQRNKLKEIELKNSNLEKQQLASKLDFKSNQLTNYAFYIVKKNEFLDSIKSEIDELKLDGDSKLNSLSKIVNQHIIACQDRKDFEIRVKDENQDFYYKLDSKFPGLSDKNKNLCSLLLLELSSKEIASLLNISVDSVEKSRYRLRKKLDISREITISSFLKNL